jgi:hypothetical protein
MMMMMMMMTTTTTTTMMMMMISTALASLVKIRAGTTICFVLNTNEITFTRVQ